MSLEIFFVRETGTDRYFPEAGGRRGRGGSFTVPIETKTPRIFRSQRSAKIFISTWRKGEHHHESDFGYDYEGNSDYYEGILIKPVPDRAALNLEIVPVTFSLPGETD